MLDYLSPQSAEESLGFRLAIRGHKKNESAGDAAFQPGFLISQIGVNLAAAQFRAEFCFDDHDWAASKVLTLKIGASEIVADKLGLKGRNRTKIGLRDLPEMPEESLSGRSVACPMRFV